MVKYLIKSIKFRKLEYSQQCTTWLNPHTHLTPQHSHANKNIPLRLSEKEFQDFN